MSTWKNNLSNKKSDPLLEATAAETFYKQIALVKVMKKVEQMLEQEVPHKDILDTMRAMLQEGLKGPQSGESK